MPSKKSSRKKSSRNGGKGKENKEFADMGHKMMRDEVKRMSRMQLGTESKALLDKLQAPCQLPPEETRPIVRKLVELTGTDVEQNDNDPYGDGDQSLVGVEADHDCTDQMKVFRGEPTRQILRDLFAIGGDLESHLRRGGLSSFAMMCCLGRAAAVEKAILETAEGSEERMHLLERRETGMRLSPLLLAIAGSKCKPNISAMTLTPVASMDHLKCLKILLQYGARPDCKDLAGKTAVHYGAGSHASEDSLAMTDYAVEAAKSSASFGKKVVLRHLKKEECNGLTGTLGGFMAETGRRQVTLDDGGKPLALLPKNIFSVGEGGDEVCVYDESRNLLNDYDRFGSTSMHEVYITQRHDVAEFLIERNVSIDIGPVDGTSGES